tara:strand:+ start:251 stop:397 length:147 start_codon:yes stop_codon:yes gene_type:complete
MGYHFRDNTYLIFTLEVMASNKIAAMIINCQLRKRQYAKELAIFGPIK